MLMNRTDGKEYVLSLSYGKDSLGCLGAIEELGWPLDRIVHAEVWATDTVSYLQGTSLVTAHPDRFVRRFCRHGGDGEGCCEDGCRQCCGDALFRTGHLHFLLISVFCVGFASDTISKQKRKVDRDKRRNTGVKIKRITQYFVVFVKGLFRCDDFLDHINSHRQTWNTWKHCFQRVPESK